MQAQMLTAMRGAWQQRRPLKSIDPHSKGQADIDMLAWALWCFLLALAWLDSLSPRIWIFCPGVV